MKKISIEFIALAAVIRLRRTYRYANHWTIRIRLRISDALSLFASVWNPDENLNWNFLIKPSLRWAKQKMSLQVHNAHQIDKFQSQIVNTESKHN